MRAALMTMCATLMVGCAEPPSILPDLAGEWHARFWPDEGDGRDGTLAFAWDAELEEMSGTILMADPDDDRSYDLLVAEDIRQLGIALSLVEQGGVRQLFVEVMPPNPEGMAGAWRTRWGCAEMAGSLCGEQGGIELEAR